MTAKFPLFALVFFLFIGIGYSQCPTDLLQGQNLVTNPDFSDGYTGWSHDPQYSNYGGGFSVPGNIYAGASADYFNPGGFDDYNDHSPSSDNMYLMVDGICTAGVVLWSQNNIPISPNTNYYFGVWISSLKDQTDVGKLIFQVNGINLVNDTVKAPQTGQVWQFVETVWYSGMNPPTTATITIANITTVGCATQVDFAIDDISFIPGCSYGSPGPQPNLGPDVTVCGTLGGQVTLDAGLPVGFPSATTTITWSTGATGTGVSAPTSITVGPGTYSVCLTDNGSCVKSDVVVVLNNYTIDLGNNLDLCANGSATLDPRYTAASVTYLWKLDGNPAPGNNTSATYVANTPGAYSVEVTPAGCAMQTDNVTITSTAPLATNATFCPTQNATLSVSPANSGKYKWWNHPTSTSAANLLQTGGTSYTFSATASSDYTYYVEDTASFRTTIGPPLSNTSVYTGGPYNRSEQNETNIVFDALQAITIDSVWMYLRIGGSCPDVVGLEVRTSGNVLVGASGNYSITAAVGCVTNTWVWVKVPVNIAVPVGTNYTLKFKRPGNAEMSWWEDGFAYPQTYASAVTFKGPHSAILGWKPNSIPGMWRWVITAGNACARVPVKAIYDCPPCMTATEPTSVTADNTTFCVGAVSQITLSAVGGSGPTLAWYSGSCGGTPLGTGNNLNIPSPSVPTTYYARYEDGVVCASDCKSVLVTPVQNPTTPNAGSDQTICNVSTASISANTPTVGTGAWSVVSGTGTIGNTASASTSVSGIGAGDFVLQWTISNAPCAALNAQLTIHRDVLTAPSITFANSENDTCANTTGLNFQTSVLNASNTYAWTSNGTVLVTSQTSNTAVVSNGASGGKLFVTETSGSCQIKDSVLLTITPDIAAPNAGADQAVCTNAISLNATGSGTWSTTGSAIIANSSSATTTVSNLGAGVNTFTWTVTGCGGPLSDDVEITLGTSGLVLTASADLDTLCVNTTRTIEASVSGGSGNYQYVWSSSDNSVSKNTNADHIDVTPAIFKVTYYVVANDVSNSGCSSNTDSITFISVSDQELVIPNLITPNGDSKNETFFLADEKTNLQLLPGSRIEITNRWGDRIYSSSDYDNSWNADKVTDGIFYYYLETGCGERKYKGWLQVIR